jgi:hypothetical protein
MLELFILMFACCHLQQRPIQNTLGNAVYKLVHVRNDKLTDLQRLHVYLWLVEKSVAVVADIVESGESRLDVGAPALNKAKLPTVPGTKALNEVTLLVPRRSGKSVLGLWLRLVVTKREKPLK